MIFFGIQKSERTCQQAQGNDEREAKSQFGTYGIEHGTSFVVVYLL
ncbi:hypothetical protein [Limnobacter sp.]